MENFIKLDKADKFGVMFGLLFLMPSVVLLLVDLFVNGAKML